MSSPPLELTKEEISLILLDWLIVLEEQDFDSIQLPHGFEAKQEERHQKTTSKSLEYGFLWDNIASKYNERTGKSCSGSALKAYMEENVSDGYAYMEPIDMRKYMYDCDEETGGRRYTTLLVKDAAEEPCEDTDMSETLADDDLQLNKKCGLVLPVARIQQQLEENVQKVADDDGIEPMEVEPSAGVMLTAVAEYLVAEVMELAGNQAMDNSRKHINSMDICYAIANDNENGGGLAKCFVDDNESVENYARTTAATVQELPEPRPMLQTIRPPIPSSLTDANSGRTRIDVYWKTANRFPGGNCDIFTVRYRLTFDATTTTETKVHRIQWQNFDGQHSIESGPVSPERAKNICDKLEELDWRTVVIRLHQSLATIYTGMRSTGSFYNVLDEKSSDNNALDTEWSTTEVMVYNNDESNPFLRLCRSAVMGPQYSPNYGHHKYFKEGTAEQKALIDMLTTAVGMGRPEEFSSSCSPAGSDRGRTHTLPTGIPYAVCPDHFLY
ncbi:unnamed protein product [Cylindrotheca closterium]|uniref:Histone H2A n=1 Tax=Cylindrotheca closterium TaxID=2856 RepID=A0AAD2GD74_9STRA|nr:unnamed protein product [Cylindrotheca closterium]